MTTAVVNCTVAFFVMLPATCDVIVLSSGVDDDNVAVNVPAALVVPEVEENVFVEPEDDSVTVCPGTGFPCASSAVVTSVVTLTPSAATVLGFATRTVVVLLAAPGTNVTFVLAVAGPAVAVKVLVSALVDAKVAVNVPVASVVPEVGLSVLLDPVLARVTVCPATLLP